jgi:hypothetical protein
MTSIKNIITISTKLQLCKLNISTMLQLCKLNIWLLVWWHVENEEDMPFQIEGGCALDFFIKCSIWFWSLSSSTIVFFFFFCHESECIHIENMKVIKKLVIIDEPTKEMYCGPPLQMVHLQRFEPWTIY